jgi:hypothetical protein
VLGELYRLLPKPKVNANQARIRRQDPARLPNVLPDGPCLNCVMFLRTAAISPATSAPSRVSFGLPAHRPRCEGHTARLS